MLTGIDKNETIEFVSKTDKDKDNPTKFLLGVLTGKERVVIVAKFENNEDPTVYYDIVKKGLKGIKNFKPKKEEPKDITEINDDVLDMLPTMLIKELFLKLLEINFLTGAEQKN